MEGAGRLVLEPLPRGMEDLPLRRDLLALLLGHALLCGLAGALLPGLVERLVVLSLLCAGGWLGFRLLRGKGAPA